MTCILRRAYLSASLPVALATGPARSLSSVSLRGIVGRRVRRVDVIRLPLAVLIALAEGLRVANTLRSLLLRGTLDRFSETRAPQAAAAMAYYAVFSLFPLMLVLVAVLGYMLPDAEALRQATDFVGLAVPVSRELIEQNLRAVQQLRGPVTLVGLGALLWSASGVFSVLARKLNLGWPGSAPRSAVGRRALGIGMVAILFVLLVLAVTLSAVVDVLQRIEEPTGLLAGGSVVWEVLSRVVPWLIALLLFLGLYRWVPNAEVGWRAALWGALVAAVAGDVVKNVFVWYVSSELSRYQLVYG